MVEFLEIKNEEILKYICLIIIGYLMFKIFNSCGNGFSVGVSSKCYDQDVSDVRGICQLSGQMRTTEGKDHLDCPVETINTDDNRFRLIRSNWCPDFCDPSADDPRCPTDVRHPLCRGVEELGIPAASRDESGNYTNQCIRARRNQDVQVYDCTGSWGGYGSCNADCGGGTQTRTYTVSVPASNGGNACEYRDRDTETQVCNTQACELPPEQQQQQQPPQSPETSEFMDICATNDECKGNLLCLDRLCNCDSGTTYNEVTNNCVQTEVPITCANFDCTGEGNSLTETPEDVVCSSDPCTATECCTVPRPPSQPSGTAQSGSLITLGGGGGIGGSDVGSLVPSSEGALIPSEEISLKRQEGQLFGAEPLSAEQQAALDARAGLSQIGVRRPLQPYQVRTFVERITPQPNLFSSGIYDIFRVYLNIEDTPWFPDAVSLYAIDGKTNQPLICPPAYNFPEPFGANFSGINPVLIEAQPDAQYDSWLTLGVTDGNIIGRGTGMNSVGIEFNDWNDTTPLNITNGAIFFTNPNTAASGQTLSRVLIAQLTLLKNRDGRDYRFTGGLAGKNQDNSAWEGFFDIPETDFESSL